MIEKENLNPDERIVIKEAHHRFKNNLNIIIGLLELQSQMVEDSSVKELFRESINRIRSLAIIHEYLYRSDNYSAVDLSVYLESIADNLLSVYAASKKEFIINYRIDNIIVELDMAIPIGLLVNEIISNAIKHAFIDRQKGRIDITLEKQNNSLKLTVKDDGVGFPVNVSPEDNKTLGLKLINLLVMQLNGKYEIIREVGTTVQIKIPFNN